ncbi:MAG: 6-phosphogluconolactonase [Thermodesulfovibrionia bacterium]|nr:6-phosphogluconolactonase [Thermodesulfovibrionia bacterium]
MNKEKDVLIFKDIEEISDFVIEKWLDISGQAIKDNARFNVALSGGKTPAALFRKIVKLKDSFQWDKTHIYLVDERFVPHSDPKSNFGMISESLLRHINISDSNIHPVFIEKDAGSSAARYEKDLISSFNLTGGALPRFDLILLGIGHDGHTASLFPETQALNEKEHLAAAVTLPDISKNMRVTITLPVINNSDNIFFMAAGADKASTIREIIENKDCRLPTAMVKPIRGKLFFLMDEGAGSLL